MISAPQFVRTFAALLLLSGSIYSDTTAWSQTTDDQTQTADDPPQSTDEQPQSDTNEAGDAEASGDTGDQPGSNDEAEVAELDTLILGPWVIMSEDATKTPSKEALDASIARCFEIPKLEKLEIEPAAEKELPDAKSLIGDVVYYRTSAGLQRMDSTLGRVVLFSEIKKVGAEGNKSSWAIRGETAGLALRFASATERGGQGQFMLENKRVYLKCGPGPNSDPEEDSDLSSDTNSDASPTDEKPAE